MNDKIKNKYKFGGIELVEWNNYYSGVASSSFSISKTYKKDNEWMRTINFKLKDLLVLRELINQAIEDNNKCKKSFTVEEPSDVPEDPIDIYAEDWGRNEEPTLF